MDSEIALPGKGSPEISGIALIRAPKMGVGNYDENAAVAILHVSAMNKGVKQQAYRVDENMPFLAFDLLARIIAVRINAAPPFSPAFKLRPSMTAAAGLASRPANSRHFV